MKKKILVVEDFGSIRTFVCDTLNRKGYETVGAANMKEALALLAKGFEEIHLVLTDYNMPDGTGYDLLRKIKESADTSNIPVIFLTTESNPDKMKLAKDAGLAAWVKKPYRAENFFDQIQRALMGQVVVSSN
jgi:two-component system, chemotaxis family, chemotaxis protein CheY